MAIVINMPRLSDTMTEGVVAKWHKTVGDKVSEGDLLAEIETDKATMEFEAFPGQEGTLLYIGTGEGEMSPVDTVLAILGDEERDSGDVARRLGDDATFQSLAKRNLETLSKYKFNKIVTTDPHAFHCLKNEYGDFGSDALDGVEVMHHTTFLNQLISCGALKVAPFKGGKVTYHDPCYLGRYNGEYEAPRELLHALGIEIAEMERSGFRSRCCGGGGGAPITDIPGERRIADMRMEDVISTGAEMVAVGCQQCTAMLEGVVEPRPVVKDIAEILASQLKEMH